LAPGEGDAYEISPGSSKQNGHRVDVDEALKLVRGENG
jgi:hypothetical protein